MAVPEKMTTTSEMMTSRESASKLLEQRYVYGVYQQMSGYFKHQHYNIWPNVEHFLRALPVGSLVADIGCGNGKYLGVNAGTFTLGADICAELVEIAGSRLGNQVLTCDNLRLPYRDNAFDAVISIGVIHHLTSAKRRQQAVKELCRVLRPGGKLMICVWAFEQRHRKFGSQDVLIPWCNNDGRIPIGAKQRPDHCSVDDDFLASQKFNSVDVNGDSNNLSNNNANRFLPSGENGVNSNMAADDKTKNKRNDLNPNHKGEKEKNVGTLLQSVGNRAVSLLQQRMQSLLGHLNNIKDAKQAFVDSKKRPEHSFACDAEVFAVREFPQSSFPKKVEKQLSLDTACFGNTKYSLYLDSRGSNSVSPTNYESTTEVFSDFELRGMPLSNKSGSTDRRISTSQDTNKINANDPSDLSDTSNIAQLDNTCSSKTQFNGHRRKNSVGVFNATTSILNRNDLPNNTSHSSNLSFKQFKLSYNSRMIKSQPAPLPYATDAMNCDTQRKATSTRVQKLGRVRTLSGSQTVLRDSSDHKSDLDLSAAFTPKNPAHSRTILRKLSTSAIVDSNTSHANVSCDSESLLSMMLQTPDIASAVAAHPAADKDLDYLNQDSCLRFYHVFADGEMVELIRQHVPQLCVVDARYEHANWCVIAQKM